MPAISPQEVAPPFILTLDVGTSSARAMLFDRLGRNVERMEARVTYEVRTTPDGGVEVDAGEMLERVVRSIDELLLRAGRFAPQIQGVAVSTFWHTLLGVGLDGLALTPVYTWADTRSTAEAAELRQRLDEAQVHARTGCVFHPSYLPAKLLWLYRSEPETFRRVSRWMSFGEYLYLRLFGRTVCSISMASGTGLFDQHRCDWDEEVLAVLPIEIEQLSPLGDLDAPLTGLKGDLARRWPTLREVPWFPALGDGACSNIGSGCLSPERIALMVGTSGAMRVLWQADKVSIPSGLWCYRADRRRVVMGGALSNGGNLLEWLLDTLRLGTDVEPERQLASFEPDAHGLTMLPFFAGERSPGWAASARAAIVGLSLNTRPVDILRAGLEAVAYRFALIYDILSLAVPQAREIIASGGALLHSPTWLKIMADVLGRPVVASAEPEASSRGAALLALEALGVITHLEVAPAALGQTFWPDPKRHKQYRRAVERQRQLYGVLVGPTGIR